MDIDNSCNKYVTQETKDNLKKYIEEYNTIANMYPSEDWLVNMHMEKAKYEKWMKDLKKRKEKHPFKERRIGWISAIPDYHVCCMGQSVKDWCKLLLKMVIML